MARLNFQQPLLQSSGSHDPIEMILYVNLVIVMNITVQRTAFIKMF